MLPCFAEEVEFRHPGGRRPYIYPPMLYKDEAVVLRTMRLGEADRIVTFLGKSEGKIRGVAKGIRKTKSRFGGRLEPFSRVSLVMWKGKSDLDTVTQVGVVEPFREIKEDLDRFALGEVMLEACDRVAQQNEGSPQTFKLLVEALHQLSGRPSPLVLAGFLLRLSGVAGFAPSLNCCAECGGPAAWFSPVQGGAVCPRCRSADSEEVGTGILELMGDIVGGELPTGLAADREMINTAVRLSRFYTEYHLERRLKAAAKGLSLARL